MLKHSGSRSGKRQPNLIEAIIGGAEWVGSDGKGRDGLRGYLRFLAKKHPERYAKELLAPLIDLDPPREAEPPKVFRSEEEVEAEMKRRGLPIPKGMFD